MEQKIWDNILNSYTLNVRLTNKLLIYGWITWNCHGGSSIVDTKILLSKMKFPLKMFNGILEHNKGCWTPSKHLLHPILD